MGLEGEREGVCAYIFNGQTSNEAPNCFDGGMKSMLVKGFCIDEFSN